MATKPDNTTQHASVWAEYAHKGANVVLKGLSFVLPSFDGAKEYEVQLLENISSSQGTFSGEMDVQRICTVVEDAMAPLKAMYFRIGVVSAVFFFAGRTLSILPFIPAICYLMGGITFFVARDLYLATQQMKYTFTHFNTMLTHRADRMDANRAVRTIDAHARQSICDMLLFGQITKGPSLATTAAQKIGEGQTVIDPSVVTLLFFPALASLVQVQAMAKELVSQEKE
ncbi:MAG: hypothetical protein H7A38_04500 [Chlamydiales bacterium]|nr:hypothetical protein [Chlamydiales bacterium]